MSYNNVTDLIAALKAMDARVRAAILHDELEEFGKSAEDELKSLMKQVARSSAEWRDVINKENLFLITFGFHWRQIHGKVTADVFGKRMREELRVWMDRQRLVRREESTPTKARSPKPADRVHGAPPLSRPREPSLPIIATLASAGATPPPMVGTTPPPMEITRRTPVPIAGPSDNRRQVSRGEVSRQEADDRELAERLQAALHDGHPLSFRELDQSESSTEGDDEDDESEKKGKGKAKMPSKGKVKAGGTGMTRVFHSPTEDEDMQDEVGKTQSPKVKEGRKAMKGTGEPFPTACKTCVRRNVLCEKREGGQPPCVTCKRSKVKCSLVGKKLKRRVVKTRPMITDSDFEQTAAAEASAPKRSAPKRSAAVNKTLKRSRRQAKVEPELSEEEEVVPKKKARNQDRIAGDAEEVLGVVQDYITRLNAQEAENGQFRQLFTLLGEAVSKRTERMLYHGEYLNKVALGVLDLTQERLHELASVQRRQTELLATLHRVMTRGVDAGMYSSPQEWGDMLEREARAMHEANESRFNYLNQLRSYAADHSGIETEMESQVEYVEEGEDLRRGVEEARRMLTKPGTEENIAEGSADAAGGGETSADDAKHAATSATHAENRTTSADDAEGETVSADEDGDNGTASADEEESDMDIDESADEDPKVKMESEEPEVVVPTSVQGRVIDLASAGNETGNRPSPPMAGALPTSADPRTTTTAPVTVAPVINVVSATPQTSQDAPGGIITTLHPPQPDVMPSHQRSRSRSPVPPTSPMVTRSISRGRTPAMTSEAAAQTARGFKRKSPGGDDIANKKSKKAGGI